MHPPWLSGHDLERPEVVARAVDALESTLRALSTGALDAPQRTLLITGSTLPSRQMLVGSVAWPERDIATVKVTTLTPANLDAGLDLIQGLVIVMDLLTGRPRALIEGGALTGLRTGALAALAARHLSPAPEPVLALVGAGVQARWALRALLGELQVRGLRLASRGAARRDALARWVAPYLGPGQSLEVCDRIEQAVEGADIVCTATSIDGPGPVIEAAWIQGNPLCIALGGANETACEFDPRLVVRFQTIVDDLGAALAEAGELRTANLPANSIAVLADVISGRVRVDTARPRLFRAVGMAAQDLAGALAAMDL